MLRGFINLRYSMKKKHQRVYFSKGNESRRKSGPEEASLNLEKKITVEFFKMCNFQFYFGKYISTQCQI